MVSEDLAFRTWSLDTRDQCHFQKRISMQVHVQGEVRLAYKSQVKHKVDSRVPQPTLRS